MSPQSQYSTRALRRRAEDALEATRNTPLEGVNQLLPDDLRHLLHELQVHQVELEMQNEELRATQGKLDAARARYFDLYDLAPVGYCTVNSDGVILEANLAAATQFGVTRSELLLRPLSQYVAKTQQDQYYLFHHSLLASGATQSCELEMRQRDGTPFHAAIVASVFRDAEDLPVLRLMLRDVSERFRAEELMRTKNLELEQARKVADKANQAKSDFLNNMSHELRSPLNTILGFAQLLDIDTPPPTPAQRDSIDHIQQAGWYLLDLIDEILGLSAVEAGTLPLAMQSVSLQELLQECQMLFGLLAFERGIRMQLPIGMEPVLVHADRLRLKQVLVNLFSNALKYNRERGTVEVRCDSVGPGRVRVSVQDTGAGLSKAQLAQLFLPFNRLDKAANGVDGTGIGLAICKRLMALMGGAIGADSTPGVGSVFWIELKLEGNAK